MASLIFPYLNKIMKMKVFFGVKFLRLICPSIILAAFFAGALSFLAPGPGAFAAEKPKKVYKIRFGTITPAGTPWAIVALDLLIPVARDITGGRIRIIPYTAGVMGNDLEILEKINRGEAEACGCTAPGIFDVAPEFSVFSIPFLFSSFEEVDYVLNHIKPEIDRILETKGFVRAAFVDAGFYHLYSKLDPSSLEKIRRQKIGNFWGTFELTTLKALGIEPIPLNLARATPQMLSGEIDGTIAPGSGVLALQVFPMLKYMVEQPFCYNPAAGLFSKKALDRISEQIRNDPEEFRNLKADFERFQKETDPEKYLDHLGLPKEARKTGRNVVDFALKQKLQSPEEVIPMVFSIMRQAETSWSDMLIDFENQTQDGFVRRGMKIVRLNDDDMKIFQELSRKLQDDLAGKLYPREFLDEILQLKKEFSEKALQDIFK